MRVGIVKRLVWMGVVGWLSLPILAQPVQVNQTLSTANSTVGDKIVYTLTITYPKIGVLLPLPSIGLPTDVAITRFEKEKAVQSGQVTERFTAQLVPFAVGRFVIPTRSIAVRVNGTVQTVQLASLSMSVRSVLSPSNRHLSDLKRGPSPSVPIGIWVIVALGVLGIGGIIVWFRSRSESGPSVVAPVDPVSPYPKIVALVSESEDDLTALSYAVRLFLTYRFGCHALGLTTRELIGVLETRMSEPQLAQLERVLSLCDQVKFARYVPTAKESQHAHSLAVQFVTAFPDPVVGDSQ